jgi:hypothetical protein
MYIQKKSLAMGAPTSSLFSEVFLKYLENTKIYDILQTSKVEGYFRYVDDVLLVYKDSQTNINEVLNQFNSITPGLNFTLELEHNRIKFFDLTIIKDTNRFYLDIYRKPTTTDIIIPKDSCHPTAQKMAAIR